MSDISGYEIFHFVCDALLFVTLVASITFAICAAVRLHRRRDPARRVFSWVKIAWLLFVMYVDDAPPPPPPCRNNPSLAQSC